MSRIGGIRNVELYVHKIQVDYTSLRDDHNRLKEENKKVKEELKDYCDLSLPERKRKNIGGDLNNIIQDILNEKGKASEITLKKKDVCKTNDCYFENETIQIDPIDKRICNLVSEKSYVNPFISSKTAELHTRK